jgi:hypothetical protein
MKWVTTATVLDGWITIWEELGIKTMNSRMKLNIYYDVTFFASPSSSLQESVALTLPSFIILVYLALVTDCYVVIIVPRHPHPLTSSQHCLSVALSVPHFFAHHKPRYGMH